MKAYLKIKFVFFVIFFFTLPNIKTTAAAAGLNSENYSPAIGQNSAIMGETPKLISPYRLMLGYTMSYALRPIEYGNGQSYRLSISEHLQVNHFSFGYGLSVFDVGVTLPIALYSNPSNPDNYLLGVGTESRTFLLLSDPKIRGKYNFISQQEGGPLDGSFLLSASLPLGSTGALLSDNAFSFSVEAPLQWSNQNQDTELYVTPGVLLWSNRERLLAYDKRTRILNSALESSSALLLNFGVRQWVIKKASEPLQSVQLEAGIRGRYVGFIPTLNQRMSPTEWSVGAAGYFADGLSAHVAVGSGLGSGVGAPMFRGLLGLRYAPPATAQQAADPVATKPQNTNLAAIMDEGLQEAAPSASTLRDQDESVLRLLNGSEIIDIGAVRFEFDSARLTAEARHTVELLSEQLHRLNPQSIHIEGHTDSIGSYDYNLSLSQRRADSVKDELIKLGHNGDVITTGGMSYSWPLTSNATRAGRAQNRRIEVALDGNSFRKPHYSKPELETFKRWIYPNGRKPHANEDMAP